MSSRYSEPTWQECPRCRAVVPAGSAFCPECGERLDVRRAADEASAAAGQPASAYPATEGRGSPPWLPMALGFGGAAILGLAVIVTLLLTAGDDPALADASASATPSASADPSDGLSASEAPSEEPTPSATPSPTPRPALANRSIASVGSDAELRSQPGGGEVVGRLGSGSRVFIIGSPQDPGGERWYRVAVVSPPYSGCIEGSCPADIGFVSDGTSEADATLAAVHLDCPGAPIDAATLGGLLPLERLACYGGSPITVSGTLTYCYCDGPMGTTYNPSWLAAPVAQFLFHDTVDAWVRFERNEFPADIQAGFIVEATLAMEHDAAPDCTTTSPDMTTAEIVLYCRTQLVVESLEVVGFDESVVQR